MCIIQDTQEGEEPLDMKEDVEEVVIEGEDGVVTTRMAQGKQTPKDARSSSHTHKPLFYLPKTSDMSSERTEST